MNPAHTAATASVGIPALAQVLLWLTHWPIQPLDPGTALALAGIVGAAASAYGITVFGSNGSTDAVPPAPAPAPVPRAAEPPPGITQPPGQGPTAAELAGQRIAPPPTSAPVQP